jgi:hypothetical protein
MNTRGPRVAPSYTHRNLVLPVEYRQWKICCRAGAIDKGGSIYLVENVELLCNFRNNVRTVSTTLGLSQERIMNKVTCYGALYVNMR